MFPTSDREAIYKISISIQFSSDFQSLFKEKFQQKKMDQIVANPGFSHIAEKIFFELDQESLISCQNVNNSWKLFLEDPIFWLNKMKKSSSVSVILYIQWKELHQNTKNSELEQNLNSLIIRMKDDILAPLHAAAKFG